MPTMTWVQSGRVGGLEPALGAQGAPRHAAGIFAEGDGARKSLDSAFSGRHPRLQAVTACRAGGEKARIQGGGVDAGLPGIAGSGAHSGVPLEPNEKPPEPTMAMSYRKALAAM